jgi:alpha-glucosidase
LYTPHTLEVSVKPHAAARIAPVTLILMCASLAGAQPAGRRLSVASPNGALEVSIGTQGSLTWSVSLRGEPILQPSPISMTLDGGRTLGAQPVVAGTTTRRQDQVLRPVVRIKRAEIPDRFNERRIDFAGDYSLIVRAYDDGVAYRFATKLPGEVSVMSEEATFSFPGDYAIYFPEETSLLSHQERLYKHIKLSEITQTRFSSLPALVEVPGGPKVVITEADLLDYPGMDLTGGPGPHDEAVVERAPYMARTRGTREFPWRVLVVAERDAALLESDIVYRLASETALADTSWIRPGKVAWDWWNDWNVFGVPFRAGVNTDTYKHYIDFASENGIEYVILDEGWYKLGNLLAVTPGVDVQAIVAYGKQKKVGVILWCIWKTLDGQMAEALDQFQKWGVAGVKVDFMQREDQWMVNFYERTVREAAKRHLLVDFHGAYKPTGLYRTYPNLISNEGVVGMEHSKWSKDASPDNAVTFPFMRMLAGPVDYTPGAMLNATKDGFQPVYSRPMSQGTRCQQLAMYVVFESPLQMLADSPSNYRREPESLAFLAAVPTVWDETRVLDAKVGEYIVTARRKGQEWYVGAMTNWQPRDLVVDLSFLGTGAWQADTYRDGVNADRAAVDYAREKRAVKAGEKVSIHLAPGGGWVARIGR